MLFGSPRADSAKEDAHCAIETSLAPAPTIRRINTQKAGFLKSSAIVISLPSSVSRSIGQTAKLYALTKGTTAHTQAAQRQFSIPKSAKNAVESSTTPTTPNSRTNEAGSSHCPCFQRDTLLL